MKTWYLKMAWAVAGALTFIFGMGARVVPAIISGAVFLLFCILLIALEPWEEGNDPRFM